MDEARHTRLVGALTREAGGRMQPIDADEAPVRSLEELAVENAVEGCVGETWAALQATWQASHAPTAQLRAIFAEIARDEAAHAELARDLHRWLTSRLDAAAIDRVDRARHAAWERLDRQLDVDEELVRSLGLPDREAATRLARGLRTALA